MIQPAFLTRISDANGTKQRPAKLIVRLKSSFGFSKHAVTREMQRPAEKQAGDHST